MTRSIQSSSNPRIQAARKLLKRRKDKSFLIEGKKLFEEAIRSRLSFKEVFVTPEIWESKLPLFTDLERDHVPIYVSSAKILKTISDVETPPGLIGVVKRPEPPSTLRVERFALLLLSIRDPGNFGAIVRTAEACGCEWIAHTSDCADPFSPKVVRASMGSLFRVPLLEVRDWNNFVNQLRSSGTNVCALQSRGGIPLTTWKARFPILACIGSESHGLPQDLPVDEAITIPMQHEVESLNAAVAASVFLFWISTR
jgi:RNA methyltransferase, TrmH family